MTTPEIRAAAIMARGKIAALWAARHSEPEARHLVHYWVRIIRLVENRKR